MASTSDIRDIMDMGRDGQRPPAPKKKKKVIDSQQRLTGMSREVQALMGDSVPPVAIVETPKYKSKPSLATRKMKPRHWENRPFEHAARKDGLVLRHWKRMLPGTASRLSVLNATTPVDVEMTDSEKELPQAVEIQFEEEFPMDKWNVQIPVPSYTLEQYQNSFISDDWTKEETDYLLELAQDYDLRWLLIADRYDPTKIQATSRTDTADPMGHEILKMYPERNMEALKSRYYTIAAKTLEQQTPASNMTQTEFQLWEKMRNFDAKTELLRKTMAEKLFERTKDEADEERTLLEELHRITKNEEDFIKMRKDLYSRLESAPSLRRNERGEEQNVALYQTSGGLSMLLQSLLAKEKRFKRPALPSGETPTSASGTPHPDKGRHPNQYSRRDTMDTQADDLGPQKKGSISQPVVRTLSVAEEVKYGVSHPTERLTSGVMFRHEKINRITTAKSQVQTQKINAALNELGIPPRLSMPTERVCREFERLVGEVQLLLDARRNLEKITSEVKILEEMKRQRLGQPKEDEDQGEGNLESGNGHKLSVSAESQEKNGTANTDNSASNKNLDVARNTGDIATRDEDDDEDEDPEDDRSARNGARREEDEDEDEDAEVDESAVQQDDEDDEEEDIRASFARRDRDDDDDEDEEEEAEGQGDGDEDEDEDDDDVGLQGLRRRYNDSNRGGGSDEEEENAEQEEDDEEEDDEDDEEEDADVSMALGADNDEDEDDADEQARRDEEENGSDEEDDEGRSVMRPTSSGSAGLVRSHKRSASVISEASKAGSNRSGVERKKRK